MASSSRDAAHHAYWPSAQDSQMSRGNRSEPVTPNSPGSGSPPFRTNGPPSSRSWAGPEHSAPLEPSSGYGRHQAAPERTMGATRTSPSPLPSIRTVVPEFDQLRTQSPEARPPIAPAARQPSTSTLTSSPGEAARTTLPAPTYTYSPSQAKRKRVSHWDSGEQLDSRVPRSAPSYSMPPRESGEQLDSRFLRLAPSYSMPPRESGEQLDSRVPRSAPNFFTLPQRELSLDGTEAGGNRRWSTEHLGGRMLPRELSLDGTEAGGNARWPTERLGGHSTESRPQEVRPGPLYSQQRSLAGPWTNAAGGVTLPRLPDIGEHRGRSPLDSPRGGMSFRGYEDLGGYNFRATGPPYDPRHVSRGSYGSYQDDEPDRRPRKRRGNLPRPTTEFLSEWLHAHIAHAYPNEEEKQWMVQRTGLSIGQISNWFINARRRKLPLLKANAQVEANLSMDWSPSPRTASDQALSDRDPSLDADSRDSHASNGRSLARGHEGMGRGGI